MGHRVVRLLGVPQEVSSSKFITPCEGLLQLSDVTLVDQDESFPVERAEKFIHAVQQFDLRFAFHDGEISELCPEDDETDWVLNFKRGVLALFQNTMKRFDINHNGVERDVHGTCDVEYSVRGQENTSLVLVKRRDLSQCKNRYKYMSILQTVRYNFQSKFQTWPVLKSESKCRITVDHHIYKAVTCRERHLFEPFSGRNSGAMTTVIQELVLREERNKTDSEYMDTQPKTWNVIGKRANMLHHHLPIYGQTDTGEVKPAREVLRLLCLAKNEDDSEPSTVDQNMDSGSIVGLWGRLVRAARPLHHPALTELLKRASTICPEAQKHLLDALPYIASTGSVELIKDKILKDEVDKDTRHEWLMSLAMIPRPKLEMLKSMLELLQQQKHARVVSFATSSMLHSYCKHNGKPLRECCEEEIPRQILEEFQNIVNEIVKKGIENNSPREDRTNLVIAMKALGNIGGFKQEFADVLMNIIGDSFIPIPIRLTAVEAFRRTPCEETREYFLETFREQYVDIEIRLASYLQVMRCPDLSTVRQIFHALRNEKVNQAATFVWSHLNNLGQSSLPSRVEIQGLLSGNTMPQLEDSPDFRMFSRNYEQSVFFDQYNAVFAAIPRRDPESTVRKHYASAMPQLEDSPDFRMFSRNYEQSVFFDQYNAGGNYEANVIFSPDSYIPRSVGLNLTIDMFGESINIFEMKGRAEGFETYFENVFGNNGVLSKNNIMDAINNIRNFRSLNDADDVRRKIDDLGYKNEALKHRYPMAELGIKVFGNEISFWSAEGHEEIMKTLERMNPQLRILEILSGKEISYNKASLFLDTTFSVPTGSGLPLKLNLMGTSYVNTKMSGTMIDKFRESMNLDFEGKIRPSMAVNIAATMSVNAGGLATSGIRLNTRLYTATGVEAKLSVRGLKAIRLDLSLPIHKQEIFAAKSELIVLHGDEELQQQGLNKNRIEHNTCSWSTFDNAIGVKVCAAYQFPNMTNIANAPYFLMSGPAKYIVSLEKADPSAKTFSFEYKWDKNATANHVQFTFNTPNSQEKRSFNAEVTLSNTSSTAVVSMHCKDSIMTAKALYRNLPYDKSLEEKRSFNAEVTLSNTSSTAVVSMHCKDSIMTAKALYRNLPYDKSLEEKRSFNAEVTLSNTSSTAVVSMHCKDSIMTAKALYRNLPYDKSLEEKRSFNAEVTLSNTSSTAVVSMHCKDSIMTAKALYRNLPYDKSLEGKRSFNAEVTLSNTSSTAVVSMHCKDSIMTAKALYRNLPYDKSLEEKRSFNAEVTLSNTSSTAVVSMHCKDSIMTAKALYRNLPYDKSLEEKRSFNAEVTLSNTSSTAVVSMHCKDSIMTAKALYRNLPYDKSLEEKRSFNAEVTLSNTSSTAVVSMHCKDSIMTAKALYRNLPYDKSLESIRLYSRKTQLQRRSNALQHIQHRRRVHALQRQHNDSQGFVPQPAIRQVLREVTLSNTSSTAVVSMHCKDSIMTAKALYRNLPYDKSLEASLDVNGKKQFDTEMSLKRHDIKYGYVWLSTAFWVINNERVAELSGTFKVKDKGGVKQCDISADFQTKKLASHLEGYYTENGPTNGAKLQLDYQFYKNPKQTIKMEGVISKRDLGQRKDWYGDLSMQFTAYPGYNFYAVMRNVRTLTHIDIGFNVSTSREQKHDPAFSVGLSRIDRLNGMKLDTHLILKRPKLITTQFTFEQIGAKYTVLALLNFNPTSKEIRVSGFLFYPPGTQLYLDSELNMTLPTLHDMTMHVKVHEKMPNEYQVNAVGVWFTGVDFNIDALYQDQSKTNMASHRLKVLINSSHFKDIAVDARYTQDNRQITFIGQGEYNEANYRTLIRYVLLSEQNFTTYCELDIGDKAYSVTLNADMNNNTNVNMDIHFDEIRDIHISYQRWSTPRQKRLAAIFNWNANRNPSEKVSIDVQLENKGAWHHGGYLTLYYPGRQLTGEFEFLLKDWFCQWHVRTSWSQEANILWRVKMYSEVKNETVYALLSNMKTPFTDWEDTSFNLMWRYHDNLQNINGSMSWQREYLAFNLLADYLFKSDEFYGELTAVVNSTIPALPRAAAIAKHHTFWKKRADTLLSFQYNDDGLLMINSSWALDRNNRESNVTGVVTLVTPFPGYRKGFMKTEFIFGNKKDIRGVTLLDLEQKALKIYVNGYMRRITNCMLVVNVTSPMTELAPTTFRIGFVEMDRHLVAMLVSPNSTTGKTSPYRYRFRSTGYMRRITNCMLVVNVTSPITELAPTTFRIGFVEMDRHLVAMLVSPNSTTGKTSPYRYRFRFTGYMRRITNCMLVVNVTSPMTELAPTTFRIGFVEMDRHLVAMLVSPNSTTGKTSSYRIGFVEMDRHLVAMLVSPNSTTGKTSPYRYRFRATGYMRRITNCMLVVNVTSPMTELAPTTFRIGFVEMDRHLVAMLVSPNSTTGYMRRITNCMLVVNVTSPMTELAPTTFRIGFVEMDRHLVAMLVSPNSTTGIEVLLKLTSMQNFHLFGHVALPIQFLNRAILTAKRGADEIDFRVGWGEMDLGFTGIWQWRSPIDFVYLYKLYTPLEGFEENGLVLKNIYEPGLDTELSVQLSKHKFGIAILLVDNGKGLLDVLKDRFKHGSQGHDVLIENFDTTARVVLDTLYYPTVTFHAHLMKFVGADEEDIMNVNATLHLPNMQPIVLTDIFILEDYTVMRNTLSLTTPFQAVKQLNSVYTVDITFGEQFNITSKTLLYNGTYWHEISYKIYYYHEAGEDDAYLSYLASLDIVTPLPVLPALDAKVTARLEDALWKMSADISMPSFTVAAIGRLELDDPFVETSGSLNLTSPYLEDYLIKMEFRKDFAEQESSVGGGIQIHQGGSDNHLFANVVWRPWPNRHIYFKSRGALVPVLPASELVVVYGEEDYQKTLTVDLNSENNTYSLKGDLRQSSLSVALSSPVTRFRAMKIIGEFEGDDVRGTFVTDSTEYGISGKVLSRDPLDVSLILAPKGSGEPVNVRMKCSNTSTAYQLSAHLTGAVQATVHAKAEMQSNYTDINLKVDIPHSKYKEMYFKSRVDIHPDLRRVVTVQAATPLERLAVIKGNTDFVFGPKTGYLICQYELPRMQGAGDLKWSFLIGDLFIKAIGHQTILKQEKSVDLDIFFGNKTTPDLLPITNAGFKMDLDHVWLIGANATFGYIMKQRLILLVNAILPKPNIDVHTFRVEGSMGSADSPMQTLDAEYRTDQTKIVTGIKGQLLMGPDSFDTNSTVTWTSSTGYKYVDNLIFYQWDVNGSKLIDYTLKSPLYVGDDTFKLKGSYAKDMVHGYHIAKGVMHRPGKTQIGELDLRYGGFKHTDGRFNVTTPFENLPWLKSIFDINNLEDRSDNKVDVFWPNTTANATTPYKTATVNTSHTYKKSAEGFTQDGFVSLSIPINTQHLVQTKYFYVQGNKWSNGNATIDFDRERFVMGSFKQVIDKSHRDLDLSTTDIEVENDNLPVGIKYVHEHDDTGNIDVKQATVFHLHNATQFNMTGVLDVYTYDTGKDMKLTGIQGNRTWTFENKYKAVDKELQQGSKLTWREDVWIKYDIHVTNVTTSETESQRLVMNVWYPLRTFNMDAVYRLQDYLIDGKATLTWNIRDQNKTAELRGRWENPPVNEGSRYNVDFALSHPSFKKDVTLKGEYISTPDVMSNVSVELQYSDYENEYLKLKSILTDNSNGPVRDYKFYLKCTHPSTSLDLDMKSDINIHSKWYYFNNYYKFQKSLFYEKLRHNKLLVDIKNAAVKWEKANETYYYRANGTWDLTYPNYRAVMKVARPTGNDTGVATLSMSDKSLVAHYNSTDGMYK
ncbi:lipoprotein amino terminal region domain-containing protein [Phthorimaea operculella]|nr:lipoprotein amino terminal region domain-containing protein [Phthorimaea operculella]